MTGALPGITLNLLNASPGTNVSLAIAPDTTQASTAINQFVTDYNKAVADLNTQFTFTGTSEGPLATDSAVRSLQSTLEGALDYTYTPSSGTTTMPNLSSMGITVNNDGTLTADSATLNNALQNNFSDVQNFFQGAAMNGFANSMDQQLTSFISPADGAFTLDLSSISTEYSGLQTDITNFETNYITPLKTQLTSDYSQAEIALQQLPTEMQQINTELGLNTKIKRQTGAAAPLTEGTGSPSAQENRGPRYCEARTIVCPIQPEVHMNPTELSYRRTAVEGTSGFGLLIALYDTLAGNLSRAAEAQRKSDIQKRCKEINHALLVIAHLEDWVDREGGGELAEKLVRFYSRLRAKMIEAQAKQSPKYWNSR